MVQYAMALTRPLAAIADHSGLTSAGGRHPLKFPEELLNPPCALLYGNINGNGLEHKRA